MNIKLILVLIGLFIVSGCSNSTIAINTNPINQNGNAVNTTNINDFKIEIARNNVAGFKSIHKFGRNPDIDSASGFEAIWNGGNDYTGFPSTAETMEIFSSNINDNILGTGAQQVKISGLLDSNYIEMPDIIINLSGTTPVTLGTQTYLRGNRIQVIRAGTGNMNAGLITLRHSTTITNIFAVMPIGYDQTMIAAYTIPINKTGYLTSWFSSFAGRNAGDTNVLFMVRPFNETFQVREQLSISGQASSNAFRIYSIYKNSIPQKSDIKITADSSVNNAGISAGFDLLLIDN